MAEEKNDILIDLVKNLARKVDAISEELRLVKEAIVKQHSDEGSVTYGSSQNYTNDSSNTELTEDELVLPTS